MLGRIEHAVTLQQKPGDQKWLYSWQTDNLDPHFSYTPATDYYDTQISIAATLTS